MIFHSLLAARLIIFPTSITIDRGKDYMSKVFMDACEYLQIDVVRANPRRYCQILWMSLLRQPAGWLGRRGLVRRVCRL